MADRNYIPKRPEMVMTPQMRKMQREEDLFRLKRCVIHARLLLDQWYEANITCRTEVTNYINF